MNKILLKVAGIMSLAFAGLYLFIFMMVNLVIPYNYLADNMSDYVAVLVLAILSLMAAFGGIIFLHYKDLSDEELKKKKGLVLAWSIVLFVTTGICGIIGLLVYFLLSYNGDNSGHEINYIEEIKELEKLKNKGYITEDEFTRKKKKILDI